MKMYAERLAMTIARARTVAVADCVHFCAYRYGRGETNPYEEYARGLAEGLALQSVRKRFVEYVRSYRPRHLGEALGIRLSQTHPLWHLPWRTPNQARRFPGWVRNAGSVVDVMTHFSDEGVPRPLITKEFGWHENAYAAIMARGYQPQQFSYIVARELRGERSAYLVTDGNHRLSAIAALGGRSVALKLPIGTAVVREKVDSWPLVIAGVMTREDALAVFDAYLHGNVSPARSDVPADLID